MIFGATEKKVGYDWRNSTDDTLNVNNCTYTISNISCERDFLLTAGLVTVLELKKKIKKITKIIKKITKNNLRNVIKNSK
jgi:alpha-N-acetylglucosamine transferase